MAMLAMNILVLVHFWVLVLYGAMGHCAIYTHPKVQPAALHLHCNLATCAVLVLVPVLG